MSKSTLTAARQSFESAGCNLEQVICEHLAPLGENGVDIKSFPLDAKYTGLVMGTPSEKITKVRYYNDTLEGFTKDGEWIAISAHNIPADHAVRVGELSVALEVCSE